MSATVHCTRADASSHTVTKTKSVPIHSSSALMLNGRRVGAGRASSDQHDASTRRRPCALGVDAAHACAIGMGARWRNFLCAASIGAPVLSSQLERVDRPLMPSRFISRANDDAVSNLLSFFQNNVAVGQDQECHRLEMPTVTCRPKCELTSNCRGLASRSLTAGCLPPRYHYRRNSYGPLRARATTEAFLAAQSLGSGSTPS